MSEEPPRGKVTIRHGGEGGDGGRSGWWQTRWLSDGIIRTPKIKLQTQIICPEASP